MAEYVRKCKDEEAIPADVHIIIMRGHNQSAFLLDHVTH